MVERTEITEQLNELQTEEFRCVNIIDLHVAAADLFLLVCFPGSFVILILEDIFQLSFAIFLLDTIQKQVGIDTLNDDITVFDGNLAKDLSSRFTKEPCEESIAPFSILDSGTTIDL